MISFGIIFFLLLAVGSIHSQYYPAPNPPYPPKPAYGWNVANITNPGYRGYQSQVQYQPQPRYPPQPSYGVHRNLQPNNTVNDHIVFQVGTKGPADQIILMKKVVRKQGIFRSNLSKTVEIRPSRVGKNITCIQVASHDRSVPNVKVPTGGPGKNYATVVLTSDDAPLNATVTIWGKQR